MAEVLVFTLVIIVFAAMLIKRLHKKKKNKFLVFSSVGDKNNVNSWLSDKDHKEFDLVVFYFGDRDEPDFQADLLVKRKGLKFENFHYFLTNFETSEYDAIWVVDDDIVMDTLSINKMFYLFDKYGLWLAQPSFLKECKRPWELTITDADCVLRYTNFIENGVSVFSTSVLRQLEGTFKDAGTGFGVDFLWPKLLGFPTKKIAVIDDVACFHPNTGYSSLNSVVPRKLHRIQGTELLIKYGLLGQDCYPVPVDGPFQKPFEIREYSRLLKY